MLCRLSVRNTHDCLTPRRPRMLLTLLFTPPPPADCPYIVGYFTSWFENDPGRGDMLYIQLEYCDATLEAGALGDASASGDVDGTFGVVRHTMHSTTGLLPPCARWHC